MKEAFENPGLKAERVAETGLSDLDDATRSEKPSSEAADDILRRLDDCTDRIRKGEMVDDGESEAFLREVGDMVASGNGSEYPRSDEIRERFFSVVSGIMENNASELERLGGKSGSDSDAGLSRLERSLVAIHGLPGGENADRMIEKIDAIRENRILESIGISKENAAVSPEGVIGGKSETGGYGEYMERIGKAESFDDLLEIVRNEAVDGMIPTFRSGQVPLKKVEKQITDIRDMVPGYRDWLEVGDLQYHLRRLDRERSQVGSEGGNGSKGMEADKEEIPVPADGTAAEPDHDDRTHQNPELFSETADRSADQPLDSVNGELAAADHATDGGTGRSSILDEEKRLSAERKESAMTELDAALESRRGKLEEALVEKIGQKKGLENAAEIISNLAEYAAGSEDKARIVVEWISNKGGVQLSEYWLKAGLYGSLDQRLAESKAEKAEGKAGFPSLGKVIEVFKSYYNPKRISEAIRTKKSSPYLEKLSSRGRMAVIYSDLMRISIDSGDPDMRSHLMSMERYKKDFPAVVESIPEQPDKQSEFREYVEGLESLYESSALSQGVELSSKGGDDLRGRYDRVVKLMDSKPGEHPVDRLSGMFLRPVGIGSIEEALSRMDKSVEATLKRRIGYAESMGTEGGVFLGEGDLVKGCGADFISSLLTEGIKSSEYYAKGMSGLYADKTPFGPDFSKATAEDGMVGVPFSEAIEHSAALTHGDVWVISKNRGQYDFTEALNRGQSEYGRKDLGRYEAYGIGDHGAGKDHFDVRTGISASEIDALVVKDSRNAQRVVESVVKAGRYVPVADRSGKLILTPDRFNELVEKMA